MPETNAPLPAAKNIPNDLVCAVVKKTLLLLIVVTGSAMFLLKRGSGEVWWSIPGGIVFGATLGVVNFRWLAKSVERYYLKTDQSAGVAKILGGLITFIKLTAIFVVLYIVIKWHVFNILALVLGLSISFVAIIWQGIASVGRAQHHQ